MANFLHFPFQTCIPLRKVIKKCPYSFILPIFTKSCVQELICCYNSELFLKFISRLAGPNLACSLYQPETAG